MRPAYENTQALKAQILAHVGRGYRLHQLAALQGMPSAITVTRWQRADPGFAAEMRSCRMYARGLRWESRGWFRFDPAWAELFLQRVRQVGMIAALRTPGQPCRNQVDRWRKVRPEFEAELAAAKRAWRRPRRRPTIYTEAVADQIILKLIAGVRLRALRQADPQLPGVPTVRRWRREVPEFDGAVRIAMRAGHLKAVRMAAMRSHPAPALTETIAHRVIDGASLNAVGQDPEMPRGATLHAWARRHADFARSMQIAYELREIRRTDAVLEAVRRGGVVPRRDLRRTGEPRPVPGETRWGRLP